MLPGVRSRRAAWALGCLALVLLLAAALHRLDIPRLLHELREVRASWLGAAVVSYGCLLPLWALEWRILAPPVARNTFPRMLGVVAITSATQNTAILLVGEATGVLLLVTRIGLERSAALSVLAMDQLLVGVAKLGVLAIAAWLLVLPPWMKQGMEGLSLAVLLLLAGTVFASWHYEAIASKADALLPPRLVRSLRAMGEALAPLRSPSRCAAALTLASAKKLVEVLAIVCVQHAFGVSLPLSASVMVLAALSLITMVPLWPASVGVYEGAVALVYTRFGIPAELAVGMAIVQHAAYLTAMVALALAAIGPARRFAARSSARGPGGPLFGSHRFARFSARPLPRPLQQNGGPEERGAERRCGPKS